MLSTNWLLCKSSILSHNMNLRSWRISWQSGLYHHASSDLYPFICFRKVFMHDKDCTAKIRTRSEYGTLFIVKPSKSLLKSFFGTLEACGESITVLSALEPLISRPSAYSWRQCGLYSACLGLLLQFNAGTHAHAQLSRLILLGKKSLCDKCILNQDVTSVKS